MKFILIILFLLTNFSFSSFSATTDKVIQCSGVVNGTYTLIDKIEEYGFHFWEYMSDQLTLTISIEKDLSNSQHKITQKEYSEAPQVRTLDVSYSAPEKIDYISSSARSFDLNEKLKLRLIYRLKKSDVTSYLDCNEI